MKISLFLAKKKMIIVFLLALLKTNRTRAGEGFRNCLKDERYCDEKNYCPDFYSSLLNFPFNNNTHINNGRVITVCCDDLKCIASSYSMMCDGSSQHDKNFFYCVKINQAVFCSESGDYPWCSGIVGNMPITNNTTIGTDCKYDFEAMEKNFADKFNCPHGAQQKGFGLREEPGDESGEAYPIWGLNDETYAIWSVNNTEIVTGLSCGWDNGGWTCYDSPLGENCKIEANGVLVCYDPPNENNAMLADPTCYLQWKSSLPPVVKPSNALNKMEINSKGLPTPWPIGLIGTIISVVNIFLFESEKYSFGLIPKSVLAYNILRSSVVLISSMISLEIYGKEEFYYPELALLTSLTLPIVMFAVKRGMDKIDNQEASAFPLRDLRNGNRNEEARERETLQAEQREHYQTLKKIYSLRYLCWGIAVVSFIWGIVATTFTNPPQFIVDCCSNIFNSNYNSFVPFVVGEGVVASRKGKGSYFLDHQLSNIVNYWIRIIGLVITGIMIIAIYAIPKIERWRGRNMARNVFRIFIYFPIAAVFISYLVTNFVVQTRGLNVAEELDGCYVDKSLISSKTGYLKEWTEQKLDNVRKFSLF